MTKLLTRQPVAVCHWCLFPVEPPVGDKQVRNTATMDHLRPVSHGGTTDVDNCVLACKMCNSTRGNMSAEAWMDRISGPLADWLAIPPIQRQRVGLWSVRAYQWHHLVHVAGGCWTG